MSDRYQQLIETPPGRFVSKQLGLPQPERLRRYEPGQSLLEGPALLGGGGGLLEPVRDTLTTAREEAHDTFKDGVKYGALVFDASAIASSAELKQVYEFFHPAIRSVRPSGRVLVLGRPPESSGSSRAHTAQRALEGFTRSVGKELRHGATVQLVQVEPGGEQNLESTLRFLLSARSAYVDAQVVRVGPGELETPADWDKPLAGKLALVTGASRGIGESIADTLARDGAQVVCLDVPQQGDALAEVANRIGGETLQLDITADNAPELIVQHLRERHGGVDVVVHNAGVTRDKTLGRMDAEQWDMVLGINIAAQERINHALLDGDTLRKNGRIVAVSSQSGIAGNAGQTNYATSKAAVIGMVHSLAPELATRPATINAVAPGFIETKMTAAMPTFTREAGRRLNSMSQGGLPIDVAETIAWMASPASGGVNGNVVRVCGQSLLGA
ncbi:MAG TPA: 3-oxoacyl-ACP reductase [Thermoleophilaceae bacterium]